MNPLILLDSAVVAIRNRTASGTDHWYLCWHNNGLMAWPKELKPKPIIIFTEFDEKDATQGFTSKHWDELTKELAEFYIRKGIEPCPQKPSPQTKQSDSSTTSTPRKETAGQPTKPSGTN